MTPTERILAALADRNCDPKQNSNGWKARCPAHNDRDPSLSISEADDGRVLLHCFVGCDCATICKAVGLAQADLFPPKPSKPGYDKKTRQLRESQESSPPAAITNANKLDLAYRSLLAELKLSADHRNALLGRGLSDEDIDAGGYRTLPDDTRSIVRRLAQELNDDYGCVPGFGKSRIFAPAGLVVPVRDIGAGIVAIKVRPDKAGSGPKYLYLSSAKSGGPSPGAPAHVPVCVCGSCELVRITEGELKADVATRISGVPTISFPGVSSWRTVLPVLNSLGAKTARVAFDADARENKQVAHALLDCIDELQTQGFSVELETWPLERGKGIDDLLSDGGIPDVLRGPTVCEEVQEIAERAGVDQVRPIEAVDDPHRLTRVYLARHGSEDDLQTLWYWRSEWFRWSGGTYRVIDIPEICAEICRLTKQEFDAENLRELEQRDLDVEKKKVSGPPTCRKVTVACVTNTLHALKSEAILPGHIQQPTWLDVDPPFSPAETLSTASGLLHLPSLVDGQPCLVPPTPAFFSTNSLPYSFDAEAKCPVWLRFLSDLWPDDPQSIATLQDWFGYCLTANTRQHKLLMLIGPPRSAKGTIGRVLGAVIGEQNLASPTLGSLPGPFGLWPLVGKLVAIVADARLSGRTDAIAVVERLLSISGEDPQDVHRKNMPTLTGVRLPVRFVLLSNELPNMKDASGAITTRVILLRLTKSFLGSEDKKLGGKLMLELPGILTWSIRGWQRLWERDCFEQPETGQELLDDLQDLASPIKAFVKDRCVLGEQYTVPIAMLYSEWRDWCQEHGRDHPGTRETFGKDLRAAYPYIQRVKPRRNDGTREPTYDGIGLK